jgi:hypothetical protein
MFRLQLILSISRSRTRPLFGFVPFVPNKSRQKLTRPRFEHGSIDLSPVGNSIEPKLRFSELGFTFALPNFRSIAPPNSRRTLDGLGLPLMFRRRFPRLIWRGDFLKDKELARKNVKREFYLEATNPANS